MTFTSLQKRSTTLNKRPGPNDLGTGQLGVNYNNNSPGLFFKTTTNAMVKIGPTHVGTAAPVLEAGAQYGTGELWFDISTSKLYVWTGGGGWAAVRADDPA